MPGISRRLTTLVAGVSLLGAAGVLTWTGSADLDAAVATDTATSYRLTSVNIEDSTLTLAWNGEAEKYRVRIGTNLDKPLLDTTTSDPIASLNELSERTSRSGTLRYQIDNISDSDTTKVLGGTLTLPPDAVSDLKIEDLASNGLKLTWAKAANVTHYDVIFRKKKDSEPFAIHRISGEKSAFTINTLEPGTSARIQVRAVRQGVVGELSTPLEFTTPAAFSEFAVGAWNVCSESCSGYGSRSQAMATKVQESKMDIMTLQEAGGQRVGRVTNAAFSGGERGFVRATGGSKTRYIFYRDELFDQLEGGNFSVGHGRTVTWARLKDLKTDQAFIVASVHLVPGKNKKKDQARGSQASSLVSGINRINPANDPVILAGDFNTGSHRGGDRVMSRLANAGYSDSVRIAKLTEGAAMNTYNRNRVNPPRSGDYVDHIFVSAGLTVPLWRQYTHTHGGKVLTDHNMIAAKIRLTPSDVKEIKEQSRSVLLPTTSVRETTNVEPRP